MRALRIFVKGIELDYVREDLKVREENNSFNDQLKVSYTTRPVRVVENTTAVAALGEFSIQAAGKKKYFPCKVIRGGIHYNGVLTQNEKIPGFRKCDIKFGSAVNNIMDKPVASFFPMLSVTGADPIPPYNEESSSPHNAGESWKQIAQLLKGKTFPEVKWQLPQMSWRDKYGEDLKPEDTHYPYLGSLNYYMLGELLVNSPAVLSTTGSTPRNRTVISPQVFILSPLFYAFESIGYVLSGSFVKDPFFRRLMLFSENDNMTKVMQKYPGVVMDIVTPAWQEVFTYNILGLLAPTYGKIVTFTANDEGEFIIRYMIRMPYDFGSGNFLKAEYGIDVLINGDYVGSFSSMALEQQEGEIPFSISAEQVGQTIEVRYHSFSKEMPAEHLIEFAENLPDLEYHDQHPTIDFSRYLPDWSVAEYLNNLMNTWNLQITFDDVAKEVKIDFNEEDYLINGPMVIIRKSLQIAAFKNIPSESYLLKFANDQDQKQFVSKDINAQQDENTEVIEMPFKYLPHSGPTAQLSDAVVEKDGVGLMLAAVGSVYTTDNYLGRTLAITGPGGIHETHWKRWLLFRLNAGNAVLKGPFSQTELYQISQTRKIYIDHQLWMVKAVDYKENSVALFEAELEVESVTF